MKWLKKITPSQIFIFVVHIVLLGWILYLLGNGGHLTFKEIVLHFLGIGVYGALLIKLTAQFEMAKFKKEMRARKK